MDNTETVKNRIIKAAEELLKEKDIESITSRDIAAKAQVSLGNINYHFKSKDELLSIAVQQNFFDTVQIYKRKKTDIKNPKEELKQITEVFFAHLMKYKRIGRFVLKYKLTNRTFRSERYLMPYIAKHYEGRQISPLHIKLKAMQINSVVSVAFFNSEEFFKYTDLDLSNEDDAKKMIANLIDSILEE